MVDKNSAIPILVDHFNETDWPLHVNGHKLIDRASVVLTDESADSVVVEIERHRPILGTAYTKGLGMEAFEEYFMRYAVNLSSRSVSEMTERHGHCQIDAYGIVESDLSIDTFDLRIEPMADGHYSLRESVSRKEAVVSSREEAETFVLSLGDAFIEYFSEILDRELINGVGLKSSIREDLLSTYKQAMDEALVTKAGDIWRWRDKEY